MKIVKPWVQVAIDVKEIEKARELTKIVLQTNSDWIEVGTPLIVFESIKSIESLVTVCKDASVVADFKAQSGVYKYFMETSILGANLAVVLKEY